MAKYQYAPKRRPDPYTAVFYDGNLDAVKDWLRYLRLTPEESVIRWERNVLYVEGVRCETGVYIGLDANGHFSIWPKREFDDNYEAVH